MLKMEGSDEEGEEEEERLEEEVVEENADEAQGDEGGEISFHALKGWPIGKIIKVKGQVGKRWLAVLIDSNNTHSFLNKATATSLKCELA